MTSIQGQSDPARLGARSHLTIIDLANLLFLISALIAPVELVVVASFTVYDFIILIVAGLTILSRRRYQFLPAKFAIAIYFFFLFALLSTFRATQPIESLTQMLEFSFIFFVQLPVILTLVKPPWMFRTSVLLFLGGILLGATLAMIVGQVQGAGRTQIFYSKNPNRLGYPTAYALPFVLYVLSDLWRRKKRWRLILIALPVFYMMLWALTASGSRSALVGTVIAAVVYLTFRDGLKINLRVVIRLGLTFTSLAALAYWAYQMEYFPSTLRMRIERSLSGEESLTFDRINLADAAWRAIEESPFIGVGLDNFRYVARSYVWQATDQLPHNMWLQFMANVGIVGTLAFFGLIAIWFAWMLRAQHVSVEHSQRQLLWAFIASMASVLAIYMFIPIMIQRQYWLIYGLGLALAFRTCEDPAQTASAPPARPKVVPPRWLRSPHARIGMPGEVGVASPPKPTRIRMAESCPTQGEKK
jgi:O-antigen ligase